MVKATIESRLKKMRKKGHEYMRCNKTGIIDTAYNWAASERRGEIHIDRLAKLQEVKLIQLEDGSYEWKAIYE